MWRYKYQLLRPKGRRRWISWRNVNVEKLAKELPGILMGTAPSGLRIDGWRWNKRYKRFTLFAADGTQHLIQWFDE